MVGVDENNKMVIPIAMFEPMVAIGPTIRGAQSNFPNMPRVLSTALGGWRQF
jgi:hypothetical protein